MRGNTVHVCVLSGKMCQTPQGLMKIVMYLYVVQYNLHQPWAPSQLKGLAPLRVESPNSPLATTLAKPQPNSNSSPPPHVAAATTAVAHGTSACFPLSPKHLLVRVPLLILYSNTLRRYYKNVSMHLTLLIVGTPYTF